MTSSKSARDKLFAHLDPIPVPAAIRDMLLDRYRAEVLREAAEAADCLTRESSPNTTTTLDSAWYDGADAAVQLLHRMADEAGKVTRGGSQPPAGEIPQPTAEIEFAVYGTITLSDWRYLELAPDYYGHTYMQIGGWLPEGWDPEHTPAGTQQMLRAHLHGHAVPHDLPVQVSTKGYGEPRRFMTIQWRKTGAATPDPLDALYTAMRERGGVWTTRRVMALPAPLGTDQQSVARQRLDILAERGQLLPVPGHDRAYRVNHAGGERR